MGKSRGRALASTPHQRLSSKRARRSRRFAAELATLRRAEGRCSRCGRKVPALLVVDGDGGLLAECPSPSRCDMRAAEATR